MTKEELILKYEKELRGILDHHNTEYLMDIENGQDRVLARAIRNFLRDIKLLNVETTPGAYGQLISIIDDRVNKIKSEPDGIVRETMIDNLLIDINVGLKRNCR